MEEAVEAAAEAAADAGRLEGRLAERLEGPYSEGTRGVDGGAISVNRSSVGGSGTVRWEPPSGLITCIGQLSGRR